MRHQFSRPRRIKMDSEVVQYHSFNSESAKLGIELVELIHKHGFDEFHSSDSIGHLVNDLLWKLVPPELIKEREAKHDSDTE